MSVHKQYNSTQYRKSDFIIQTNQDQWVIPDDCELLKMLLEQQHIHARDLLFTSDMQCHCFIKKLFLLALKDEVKTHAPSTLAQFARDLVSTQHQLKLQ